MRMKEKSINPKVTDRFKPFKEALNVDEKVETKSPNENIIQKKVRANDN
jgi:hypothetical protein